ncbi:MAG: 5-carboxymethyl-2-hydroxymuconate Delta-isomerase [Betaproteobacteria bacterium]|nr:5-carboxymethyl-2-hydroxymuconate Delta-isomerase [Betaproteobacteria bacterium]
MPHLVILYTGQLDAETNMKVLCRDLADAMLTVVDEAGKQVFPTGGTRVKAAQFDNNPQGGSEDYAFVYLNVRMGKGRSEATQKRAGDTLVEVTQKHFADLFAKRHIGITLQIDVGPEVFDNKHSNIHPLFAAL